MNGKQKLKNKKHEKTPASQKQDYKKQRKLTKEMLLQRKGWGVVLLVTT